MDTLTSPGFDVPTTIASYRHSLYLPNARFTTPPTPTTDYWITRVRPGSDQAYSLSIIGA